MADQPIASCLRDEHARHICGDLTYNREPQIFSRAFSIVINQTLSPKEIVVVDSGDVKEYSDDIERMVSSAVLDGTEIRYIGSERRLNGSEARNLGAAYCTGSFYCFLDDDDEWYPDRLEGSLHVSQTM